MKRPRLILIPVAVLLAGLLLAMGGTLMAARPGVAAVPGAVEGYLYTPINGPVQGGWIEVVDAQGQPWFGTSTDENGYYFIPELPENSYWLTAYPPEGLFYGSSLPTKANVVNGQTALVDLFLTEVRVSGWVKDQDDLSHIAGVGVVAHNEDWSVAQWAQSDFDGKYGIGGLEEGITYTLELYPPAGSPYVPVQSYVVTPTIQDFYVFLRIPPANLVGQVKSPAAVPVPNALVTVYNDSYWDYTSTTITGSFALANVPPGAYWVQADPPWLAQGLTASAPFMVVLTDVNSLVDVGTITLPYANKVVDGHVYLAGTAQPVPDALVKATRLDAAGQAVTTVDENGAYSLSLGGGEWQIRVEPATPPAGWTFAGPPAWVAFELNDAAEGETLDLEVVAADAQVTGHLACPGGVPCAGSPPPEQFWVELRNERYTVGAAPNNFYNVAIPVPAGWYELVVSVNHPGYQGPAATTVYVGSGETLDLGLVEILARDAHIEGIVTDEWGEPVFGVPVVAWQSDGDGWSWDVTNGDGYYILGVAAGEWFVTAEPGPLPYVLLNQPPIAVTAVGGAVVGEIDFFLTTADAQIRGRAVDENSGDPIMGLDGWAWAERYLPVPPGGLEFFAEGRLWRSGFALKARGNETYQVRVAVPPQAPYLSGGTGPVEVTPGGTTPVAVPLLKKDGWIGGVLLDGLTGTPLTGVTAEVYGQDSWGHWASARVDPATGEYLLGVVGGAWSLGLWIDPVSGYAAATQEMVVTAQSGVVTNLDMTAWPLDSSISGYTFKPDSSPQAGALVYVQGYSAAGYFETQTTSDGNGYFEVGVPAGVYELGGSLPAGVLAVLDWAKPLAVTGIVAESGVPVTDLSLLFREIDASISGVITFAPNAIVEPSHPVYVWAWSDNGGWAETAAVFQNGIATYDLDVRSGVDWHVGAVYDDWQNGQSFRQADKLVAVPSAGSYEQDMELAGPTPLLQPLIANFEATTMQSFLLPDGFQLLIPPGALADSGRVRLSIFPTRALRPGAGRPVVGYGYELRATDENGQEITHFERNVVMTLPYTEAEVAAAGLAESQLAPVYYSTLLGEWTLVGSFVVDTENNWIMLQVDHFSRFGKLGFLEEGAELLFLPAIQNRN